LQHEAKLQMSNLLPLTCSWVMDTDSDFLRVSTRMVTCRLESNPLKA
jgi:hypothetical protein